VTAVGPVLFAAGNFLSYVHGFVYIGIYWNNHHHIRFSRDGPTSSFIKGQTKQIM
jgi:hypothetical protein